MGTDYRDEYKMYSTPELRKIAASDTATYPAEAIEAARAELAGRGESIRPEPGPTPTGGMSRPQLSDLAQHYLDQTRPWVRFLSIMAFIGTALMILASLGMMAAVLSRSLGLGRSSPLGGAEIVALGILYIAMACLYIAPGIFLFRYAGAIKTLKAASTSDALENALKHQKSFWRYVGILSAIALGLTVLAVVLAIVISIIGFAIGGLG